MCKISWKSRFVAAVAAVGMFVPANGFSDDQPVEAKPAEAKAEKAGAENTVIRDVALSKEGAFAGRVVDEQGQAMDGVAVKLRRRGDEKPTETTTDDEGR